MFLAFTIDPDTQRRMIEAYQIPDTEGLFRQSTAENLHITIGYMGAIPEDDFEEIFANFPNADNIKIPQLTVSGAVFLGKKNNIFCLSVTPDAPLQDIHLLTREDLESSSHYGFDRTYPVYIPHIKIQSLKNKANDQQCEELKQAFMEKCDHSITFTPPSIALMQREDGVYKVLKTIRTLQ
ncbi:MAG: 2'-5' RNA ligase family protein [Alphaproteobacteria bacterium]